MRIAVTYENGEIFQHFGHTELFRIYDVEDGKVVHRMTIRPKNAGHEAMAAVLKKGMRCPCHVNLILLNEVAETGLSTPDRRRAEAFRQQLERRGINATIRRRLGSDINASCGQLRLGRLAEREARGNPG